MWQEIIVGTCVMMAAIFVARRYWPKKTSAESGGCGGCNGCSGVKSCRS